jgi:hypothetical protein
VIAGATNYVYMFVRKTSKFQPCNIYFQKKNFNYAKYATTRHRRAFPNDIRHGREFINPKHVPDSQVTRLAGGTGLPAASLVTLVVFRKPKYS